MPIEIYYGLLICGILLAAFIFTRILRFFLKGRIEKISGGVINSNSTSYNFLYNALSAIIYLLALIVIYQLVPIFGSLGTKIFAGAGILTVIIGFASQAALSNIIGGVFIVIFKPFRIGDVISVNNLIGEIQDITLRHVIIKNYENRRIIIPNSIISSETIVNSTIEDTKINNFFDLTIPYDSDLELAIKIIVEVATEHPLLLDNRTEEDIAAGKPLVNIRVMSWNDIGPMVRAGLWSQNILEGLTLKSDVYRKVQARFKENEISLPYPVRVLKQNNHGKEE